MNNTDQPAKTVLSGHQSQ